MTNQNEEQQPVDIKSVYLAGPMRNLPLFNFPEFNRMADNLRSHGIKVFNPAEEDAAIDGFDPAKDKAKSMSYYMTRDLPAVCQQDAVAVLAGWERSQGARLEVYVARALGKPIIDAYTRLPVKAECVECLLKSPIGS